MSANKLSTTRAASFKRRAKAIRKLIPLFCGLDGKIDPKIKRLLWSLANIEEEEATTLVNLYKRDKTKEGQRVPRQPATSTPTHD